MTYSIHVFSGIHHIYTYHIEIDYACIIHDIQSDFLCGACVYAWYSLEDIQSEGFTALTQNKLIQQTSYTLDMVCKVDVDELKPGTFFG